MDKHFYLFVCFVCVFFSEYPAVSDGKGLTDYQTEGPSVLAEVY